MRIPFPFGSCGGASHSTNDCAVNQVDEVSDAESAGSEIPAQKSKGDDTQAEEQLATTLKDNVNGKAKQEEIEEEDEEEDDDEEVGDGV